MPIEELFYPDPMLVAQAAFTGAGGAAAEEARVRQAQLDERMREYDLDYGLRLQNAGQNAGLDQQRLGQQDQQYYAGLGLQYDQLAGQRYGQDLQYDVSQQGVQQREAAAQGTAQRYSGGQLASILKQRNAQKFELAISDQKAIREARLTPRQQQQAIAGWEKRYEMPWNGPEEAAAIEDQHGAEQQMQQMTRMFADPFTPEQSLASPEELDWMSQNVPPEKIPDIAYKRRDQALKQRTLDLKAQESEASAEKKWQDVDVDNALNQQKFATTASDNELKRSHAENMDAIEQRQAKQKAMREARVDYNKDVREWAKARSTAIGDDKAAIGEKPKWEDYDPTAAFAEDEAPATSEPAQPAAHADDDWYAKIPSGATYKAPDGTTRVKP